jgi:hypothetical protein
MASFIQRKKRGIFTVTRNLSTGAVRTSSSTSTGGKNGSVRITRSIGTTGNRIYKTIRVGNAVKRTYTTTPRTKKKRGAAKDGDTIATTIILIGCLIVWGIIYAWAYILSAIAIGIVSIFLLELIRGSKKPPVIESTERKPLADK